MSCPTVAAEARRILNEHLLQDNARLKIPSIVTQRASSLNIVPEDVTPTVPTPCKLSESCTALWALLGLFSASISEERYGLSRQKIKVDVHGATLFTMSSLLVQVGGKGVWDPAVLNRAIYMDRGGIREMYRALATSVHKTADDRWFHIHGSLDTTNTLHMLDLPQHRHDITGPGASDEIKGIYAKSVASKTAAWLDIESNEFWRQPGTICYTPEEFKETPHGSATWNDPLYDIQDISPGLSPAAWPEVADSQHRPLKGIKVIDLTRVIAGPTISKILALLGADVLRISSSNLSEASVLMFDTQLGKRDAAVDLKTTAGKRILRGLIEDCDVILDGYRPGSLERLGFGQTMVHEIARRRGKGIVYARENTYGWHGPWSQRCGYQQISDCVTGVSWEQGKFLGLNEPVVPLLPNSDYQTGIVGAIAICHALYQRATTGGSYNADTSLNQFNLWYLKLGLHSEHANAAIRAKDPTFMVRHHTNLYAMVEATKKCLQKSHGSGEGEMFDPERFTTEPLLWGVEGERGTFLDWRKIVSFGEGGADAVHFGYDHGSCKPGSYEPVW